MGLIRERKIGPNGAEITYHDKDSCLGSLVLTIKGDNTALVGYISVRPDGRGRGISDQLIKRAEIWATDRGCESIGGELIPVPGSEKPLIDFLERNGFEIDIMQREKRAFARKILSSK